MGPRRLPDPLSESILFEPFCVKNADEIEEIKSEAPIQAEVLSSSVSASVAPALSERATQISEELSASNASAIGHLKSGAGGVGNELVELDQKLRSDNTEKLNTSKGSERAGAVKTRTEVNESAPDLSRAEETVINIRKKYRLNSGEFSLYRELYLMTHAVGKTECSFVVSELVKSTGMLERRVRDNLRRLKKNGWLVLLEGYDFENREKAKYRVNTEPGF